MKKMPTLKQRYQELIGISSVSSTMTTLDESNQGVIDVLQQWFSDLGFRCQRIEVSPAKSNLVATIGRGTDGLVLSGHTDTVPYDEALWSHNPFQLTERDGRWYGLGTIDMKGFFPLIIEALTAFDLTKIKRPLVVVATCDEESSMAGAQKLVELGKRLGRTTIIGEPTGLRPIRAHKGIMMERISILGQSGHSSDPSLGHNALDAMSDCLNALKSLRADWVQKFNHDAFIIPHPTMNFGCIHGGDNPNRICGQCALDFDIRTVPGMDVQAIRDEITSILDPISEAHQVQITVAPIIDPLPSFEESIDAKIVQEVAQLTDTLAETVAFGTEAPYFKARSDEVIILGAGSIDVAHQPDEYINLSDIKPAVHYLKSLIHQHCFVEDM